MEHSGTYDKIKAAKIFADKVVLKIGEASGVIIGNFVVNTMKGELQTALAPALRDALTPAVREALAPAVREALAPALRDALTPDLVNQIVAGIAESQISQEQIQVLLNANHEQLVSVITQALQPNVWQTLINTGSNVAGQTILSYLVEGVIPGAGQMLLQNGHTGGKKYKRRRQTKKKSKSKKIKRKRKRRNKTKTKTKSKKKTRKNKSKRRKRKSCK